jgi:hypothetical protein
MKTIRTSHWLAVAATAVLLAPTSSLGRDGGERNAVDARLKGFAEVPAVSTAAQGRFRATIDERAGTISYELSFSGLEGDVRMAHIHLGQRGVNGGIMVWLCQTAGFPDPGNSTPTCPQSGSVTGLIQAANVVGPAAQGIEATEFAEVVAALRAGAGYVNVHSSKFPGGEIRGQARGGD